MRIVSGTHRGRSIILPKFFKHRPTTDMAKESLFNILNNLVDIEGLKVLDLFSGTGSISYEFASRGAAAVTSVESNFRYCNFIKKCSEEFGFSSIKAIKSDALKFITAIREEYDLIFADPPYELSKLDEIPELILNAGILEKDGILILEHPGKYNFAGTKGYFDSRKYGSVNFSFFKGSAD